LRAVPVTSNIALSSSEFGIDWRSLVYARKSTIGHAIHLSLQCNPKRRIQRRYIAVRPATRSIGRYQMFPLQTPLYATGVTYTAMRRWARVLVSNVSTIGTKQEPPGSCLARLIHITTSPKDIQPLKHDNGTSCLFPKAFRASFVITFSATRPTTHMENVRRMCAMTRVDPGFKCWMSIPESCGGSIAGGVKGMPL
jgi:hypothetical protein